MTGTIAAHKARIAELENQLAALSASPAGVKPKALEWHAITSLREDGPPEPTGDIEANTMIGEYSVCFDEDEAMSDTPWCCWSPVECVGHFADFEAAKSAAFADYSARIMSAIEPDGVGVETAPPSSQLEGPQPCGIADPSTRDCPNMKEVGGGMDGERYRCAVCGKGYFLDYEEMK